MYENLNDEKKELFKKEGNKKEKKKNLITLKMIKKQHRKYENKGKKSYT